MKILATGPIMFAALLALAGCASVPPESVQLSAAVGQDILAIQKSHLFYVNSYYDRLESQANFAVDHVFAPQIITAALNGASGQVLIAKLEAGKNGGDDANDAVAFASRFVTNVRNTIEARRQQDIQPIKDARSVAQQNVEAAYAQVIQGNATITAYLASLVKIRAAQDQLLTSLKLPSDLQDKTATTLSQLSDSVQSVQLKAANGELQLDSASQKILDIRKRLLGN
jgi:hypothetical protein